MTLLFRCSVATGLSQPDLIRLIRSAPYRYKVFGIRKRAGNGIRIIAQPARELKAIQSWLVSDELNMLPVHSAATAYKTGGSIRENAKVHVNNSYLLKMDFKGFFPSIKPAAFDAHIRKYRNNKYTEDELIILSRLLFWIPKTSPREMQLSIGAPSSPFISNTITYDFDAQVTEMCRAIGVSYSRYADDLAFSTLTPGILNSVIASIRNILRRLEYPSLVINNEKTVHTSKKYRRSIVGVTLSSDGKMSLGREKKREIRAMIHAFCLGGLKKDEALKLRGWIAFANDIEPTFIETMTRKYSHQVIKVIQRFEG